MPDTLPIRAEATQTDRGHGSALYPGAGLTVAEAALRYRVSPDKVRGWISSGQLRAINTAGAFCGKPRWVIPPDAIPDFEKLRAGGPLPRPIRRRRKPELIDFYPD